jgi:hypothetical protein
MNQKKSKKNHKRNIIHFLVRTLQYFFQSTVKLGNKERFDKEQIDINPNWHEL